MTTHVEDALDTSYTLSDEQYESNTSVTTESEQKDNDEDEQLERYNSKAIVFVSSTVIKNLSDMFFWSKNCQVSVTWEQFDS